MVAGARPNFMKIAPIWQKIREFPRDFDVKVVHTGQHYNYEMSKVFFEDLNLPKPDIYLGVGSASHAIQTAKVMVEFEKVLLKQRPVLVIVVGDVNSTLACSLVISKIPSPRPLLAHIEAGLRSFDRNMPEEVNRLITDSLSDFLFTTCVEANKNLAKEGISKEKVYFVGNVMVDALKQARKRAKKTNILSRLHLKSQSYALLTLHRPENVDNEKNFKKIISALSEVQKRIKIIFPIHPRTQKRIKEYSLEGKIGMLKNLSIISPLGYLDFLALEAQSCFVLTDSGGIQEETTVLGVPCLTLRKNTERPITVKEGTNIIVGTDKGKLVRESLKILQGRSKKGMIPELWDGQAAARIIEILKTKLKSS